VDTRDWGLLDEVFVPEVSATYRSAALGSRQEVVGLIRARLETCGATQHLLGNHTFEAWGERWRTSCVFRAWHQAPAPRLETTFEVFGRYADTWCATADGWRIEARTVVIVGQVGDASVLAPVAGV
jgi:hypothetical protein